ncbi:heavy-metal-associated domain-containing protein [bacterium]|nr:heavy-metal-associated domain-containing protein [bacterium]
MKTMTLFFLISCFVQAAELKSQKTTITVKGMVCSFCAQGIEKKLKAFKEIQKVSVDLDTKKVLVESVPGQTVPSDLLQKTIKDAGYDVVEVKTE